MILPTKHISLRRSLLGVGAIILKQLNRPRTVTSLWESVRVVPEVATFERFILALDLLYMLGAVQIEEGLLHRSRE
jgi:hypothetical protein